MLVICLSGRTVIKLGTWGHYVELAAEMARGGSADGFRSGRHGPRAAGGGGAGTFPAGTQLPLLESEEL